MSKNRILIVEDEAAIATMIAMNLGVANYETQIYSDGMEAKKALQEDHAFDLALLDVMLPGMDGFDLLEDMKRYEIPVIFLTAKDDIESKIHGLKSGAEDYTVDYTVDVHIGQLRKKLGLNDHIKTVSKLGYRLEE